MGRVIAILYMVMGIAIFGIFAGHLAGTFVSVRTEAISRNAAADLAGTRVCGYPSVLTSAALSADT